LQKDSRAGRSPQWEHYEDLLLDAMQVLPLGAESGDRGNLYQALFQPAFHAVTCVTVHDGGNPAAVEVVVASPSVRVRVMQQIGVRLGPGPQVPAPGGDLQWEHAEVPVGELLRFRQAVAGRGWESPPAALADGGRDGLTVRGEVGEGGSVYRFHTWSPTAGADAEAYRYCVAILDVALASVRNARSRLALLDIYPYLRES